MGKYIVHGVHLTSDQINHLVNAYNKGQTVTLTITRENLSGPYKLYLTSTQHNKILTTNGNVKLRFSRAQLNHMNKVGGFLPLLAAIPALLGAAGGLAGGVASAVNSSRQVSEQQRHNKELENIARGGCVNCGGFLLKKIGNGLYLEPEGSGLFLGSSKHLRN